jgi:hypothetical protein
VATPPALGVQALKASDVVSESEPHGGEWHPTFDLLRLTDAAGSVAIRPKPFDFASVDFNRGAGQVYRGAPYPYPYRERHDGSIAAMVIGAAAAITGAAVLVYANRPECTTAPIANGCGYGTKVVGTAALSGGIVSLFIGALTWR